MKTKIRIISIAIVLLLVINAFVFSACAKANESIKSSFNELLTELTITQLVLFEQTTENNRIETSINKRQQMYFIATTAPGFKYSLNNSDIDFEAIVDDIKNVSFNILSNEENQIITPPSGLVLMYLSNETLLLIEGWSIIKHLNQNGDLIKQTCMQELDFGNKDINEMIKSQRIGSYYESLSDFWSEISPKKYWEN